MEGGREGRKEEQRKIRDGRAEKNGERVRMVVYVIENEMTRHVVRKN